MDIWFAHISHRHGDNYYADLTETKLRAQVADYADEYWSEVATLNDDDKALPCPVDHEERIEAYFDLNETEFVNIERIEVSE